MLSNYLFRIFVIFIFLFCLTGCVYSIHPLYTEKDIIFDPALIGEWSEKDSNETWTFTKKAETDHTPNMSYNLVYLDEKNRAGKFIVHLVKIKGKLFLDIFPDTSELKENEYYKFHLFPVHTFMQVKQIEPTLQMAALDSGWVEKHLKVNSKAISHEMTDNGIIFTAITKELQTFILKCEKTKDAFGEFSNMTKKTIKNTINKNTENKNF